MGRLCAESALQGYGGLELTVTKIALGEGPALMN